MDPKTLRTLQYERVLAALADRASSSLGSELALALLPSVEAAEVAARLDETAEAHGLVSAGERPPMGGAHDIRPHLDRAAIGGVLEPSELLAVADTIRGARELQSFLRQRAAACPRLWDWAAPMSCPAGVAQAIAQAITEQAEVADQASPKLANLRREGRSLADRLRERMSSFLHRAEFSKSLQEPIITVREGRYVLPVRQDARGAIPGVVHDVSASGATAYVEPLSCVPLNNELRHVAAEEEQEVRRVLAALSAQVGAEAGGLRLTVSALAHLDFALAKARLALDQRACRPELVPEIRFDYPAARHPLLAAATVVPVDIRLGGEFRTMVITGPNTGGKTVTLKTSGLLSLMVQSGLFIPAAPGAVATVFDEVLADIGDEQSIEQNLSTFSSHLGNIVRILATAGERSLVLLDEIGAGTDPTEGAALATALLEELHGRGCQTVATTHYGQLKAFAYTHPGVANASVSFDAETLAPTFKLSIGLPGSSNALAIARRLGLADPVVERARELLGQNQVRMEDLIERMTAEQAELERERAEVARLRLETQALRVEAEIRLREQEARWQQTISRLRTELSQAVSRARSEFDAVSKELRQLAATGDRRELERGISALRERLKAARDSAEQALGQEEAQAPTAGALPPDAIRPGLRVRLPRLRQTGYVLGLPDAEGQVAVQVGIVRVVARADELVLAEDQEQAGAAPPGATGRGGLVGEKTAGFSPELDLRGDTVADALPRVDKYLDDAILAGARQVRVIHGKGTGALREGVVAYLRGHPHVAAVSFAPPNEGGDGVAVVEMR